MEDGRRPGDTEVSGGVLVTFLSLRESEVLGIGLASGEREHKSAGIQTSS